MTARAWLDQLLTDRIAILDGAMGTMIQRHRLEERDFRGDRFAGHGIDLKGNNDVLVLTRPDIIRDIHRQYLDAGADIIETNTFNANAVSQSDYGLEALVYDLNLEGARRRAIGGGRVHARVPGLAPIRRRIDRADEPDLVDLARRRTIPRFRNITFDAMRDAYVDQIRGLVDGGVDLLADRDDHRRAQHEGGHRRVAGSARGQRRRRSARDLGHDHRPQRPHAGRPDARRVLPRDGAREAVGGRHQLRARRRRDAAVHRRARADRRVLGQRVPERRACRTRSASTTSSRRRPARCSAISPPAASSTSSAVAAARRPTTSRRSVPRSKA